MINLRSAVLIAIGLVMALAWAVMPPQSRPETGQPIAVQQQGQCPAGTTLDGKLCVCPEGTEWSGAACIKR